ncbi:hypothetical protein ACH6EH_08135 [Paenibacillus sp. JSM ZJ436]
MNRLLSVTESQAPDARQKALVHRVLQHDPPIRARMNELHLEAQEWLHQRSQAKVQRNAYESYGVVDSILMDRRK